MDAGVSSGLKLRFGIAVRWLFMEILGVLNEIRVFNMLQFG